MLPSFHHRESVEIVFEGPGLGKAGRRCCDFSAGRAELGGAITMSIRHETRLGDGCMPLARIASLMNLRRLPESAFGWARRMMPAFR